MPITKQPGLEQEQTIITQKGVQGVDLSKLVTKAMEHFKLDPENDIRVDYWSNMAQAYIVCGAFNPADAYFLPEDDLLSNKEKSCIILRLANCTGNVIDFSEQPGREVTEKALMLAKTALSIDSRFKCQRQRSIDQAVTMATRHRIIS